MAYDIPQQNIASKSQTVDVTFRGLKHAFRFQCCLCNVGLIWLLFKKTYVSWLQCTDIPTNCGCKNPAISADQRFFRWRHLFSHEATGSF